MEIRSHSNNVATPQDHYSILTRAVAFVSRDPAQARRLVYDFARRSLRRNLYQHFEDGDWVTVQKHMRALEAVIAKVEADARKAPPLSSEPPLTHQPLTKGIFGTGSRLGTAVALVERIAPTFFFSRSPQVLSFDDEGIIDAARHRSRFWWNVQLGVAVLCGVVIFALVDAQSVLRFLGLQRVTAPTSEVAAKSSNPKENAPPATETEVSKPMRAARLSPDIPLPAEYGAYAVSNGQLTELDALPIRVPDPRIAISPAIATPSRAQLKSGKVEFVLFSRDLVNTAPDRATVRVVAQVVRALTFASSGKATSTKVENTWVVRSNSYQMRVAPVPDNPEMILIRPETPNFELPAGRYALVLKGSAYDFTINGRPDSAHCLERTDTVDVPMYTECRVP